MFEVEPTLVRIGEGLKLSQRGEREAARRIFAEVWVDIGEESGDPLHRCALAHAMADVQDDASEELVWDLRALEAADLITDERATEAGVQGSVSASTPRCTSTWASAIASSERSTSPAPMLSVVEPLRQR